MFETVNAGWMDIGVEGTEHVPGTTSARDVCAAVRKRSERGYVSSTVRPSSASMILPSELADSVNPGRRR